MLSYIHGVKTGKIVAGQLVKAAVNRHLRDLRTAKKRGLYFDKEIAKQAIDFFALFKHTTGKFAGEPFLLEPWQKFLIWVLFGWRRCADGLRRFREAFVSIARGNGKSPLAAVIGLMLFACDCPIEPRAEVVVAATKFKQAGLLFSEAKRQANTCPSFARRLEVLKNQLNFPLNESAFFPLGSDSDTQDGFVLHGAILDELHAWRERHRGLYDKIDTAFGKREQPLKVTITTAGDDKSVIWKEQYDVARQVATGVFEDDSLFVLIYEIDDEDDIHDPVAWRKANPNMGISVKEDFLKRLSNKARISPVFAYTLKRYHCNKLTESASKAISSELWKRGQRAVRKNLAGRTCYGGLDLGWRDDLASFYLVFPNKKRTRFDLLGWSWIPAESERNLTEEPFRSWLQNGILQGTPGDTTDDKAILQKIQWARDTFDLQTIAIDPNNGRSMANVLVNELDIEVFEFFQTCAKYNEPCREFLRQLKNGAIRHGGDPVLTWAASNLVFIHDANDRVKPSKRNSTEKIDPVVATIMAFSEALFAGDESSCYDSRGIRSV